MIDSNSVRQRNIEAERVIGRDDNSVVYNYYSMNGNPHYEDHVLRKLLDKHEEEKNNNSSYSEFVEELNGFLINRNKTGVRDLENKLKDSGRDSLIQTAMLQKETVTKKINRLVLYKSAQDIYVHLLSNMLSNFKHKIETRIKTKKFEIYEINDYVEEFIIGPVYKDLNGCSLDIDKSELYGLLYLLTGNCHIEWD